MKVLKSALMVALLLPVIGFSITRPEVIAINDQYQIKESAREKSDNRKPIGDIKAKYIRAYDGDTITVDLTGTGIESRDGSQSNPNWTRVRLANIDAPEIRGDCQQEKQLAIDARDYLRMQLLNSEYVDLKNVRYDRWNRLLATVYVNGRNINDLMAERGYAVWYSARKAVDWCGN